MIRFVVVPKDNTPYDTPTLGEEVTYQVHKQGDQTPHSIQVVIRLQVDWAPNNVIRIEGFLRTAEGPCGVIGFYKLHSTESDLGILEIQDA